MVVKTDLNRAREIFLPFFLLVTVASPAGMEGSNSFHFFEKEKMMNKVVSRQAIPNGDLFGWVPLNSETVLYPPVWYQFIRNSHRSCIYLGWKQLLEKHIRDLF
jgi:hypothetical protein